MRQQNKEDHCRGQCLSERILREEVIESDQLFGGKNEVQIRHEGQIYRLRVTKNGKLILNK